MSWIKYYEQMKLSECDKITDALYRNFSSFFSSSQVA